MQKYQYDYKIPQNYAEVLEFSKHNNNYLLLSTTHLEMGMTKEYGVCQDKGPSNVEKNPFGFKKIQVHLISAVKHDRNS